MSNNYLSIILLATSVSCQTFSSDEKTSPASEDSGSKISEDSSSYEETQDTADLIPEETQDTADLISEETDIDLSVCQRWNTDRLNLSEGMWSGAAESCDAGSLTTEGILSHIVQVRLPAMPGRRTGGDHNRSMFGDVLEVLPWLRLQFD